MDYQQLLQLLALLNGKAGGQISGADLSRVEDPILGILTNTYNAQQDAGPNLADLSYQYRPTWESLLNEEYYDENSIEMQIASSITSGVPLMELKKQIPQFLASSGQPAGPNDSTTQEYLAYATKLDSENRDYNVALTKANTDKNSNTWWAKAGIRDPSLQADPAQILNPQLEKLAKMYKPLPEPSKTGGYMGSNNQYIPSNTFDRKKDLTEQKRMAIDEKQRLALSTTFERYLDNFELRYPSLNPFAKPRETRADKANDITRERNTMLNRRDAMSGRPAESTIPNRAAKLNKEAEDKMVRIASIMQERAIRQASQMPTPAQQDVMSRIMSLAAAEKLKK